MVPAAVPTSTSVVRVGPQFMPEKAWVLAPLIAGQPAYRLGRWIGGRFMYPRPKTSPKITNALPASPAAVMVHGVDGSVATLCLDLDTSKAAKGVVDADATRLAALLADCGLRYVEDFSPSGGRHLYVPLQERLDGAAARELVEAMTFLAPSLDPGPHQNVTDGCIRVPGSRHKTGGHQTLITPLSGAYDVLRRRNPAGPIAALRRALAPELARNIDLKARRLKAFTSPRPLQSTVPGLAGSETAVRRTARTGVYDTVRYSSDSEARLAVLTSLAGSGWSLPQVRGELVGQFPGLAALYGNKDRQERLLEKEWAKAVAWVQKTPLAWTGKKTALINDTSLPSSTAGDITKASRQERGSKVGIHQLVNDLENILYAVLDHRFQDKSREGLSLRLLIRSLLGYMRAMDTDVLDVGCRTLAVALGKHHATVARLLPVLASRSDGIVSKVADARHKTADIYLIQLPDQYRELARELSWRKGKIHGIRPVFRAIGDPAALVYEAIERGRHSPTTAEIIRSTGISRNAVDTALVEMAGLGMVHRDGWAWKITAATNLTQLAIRLGVMDDVQDQISRNRRDRAAWHAWLDRHNPEQQPSVADLYDAERDEYWLPPPDEDSAVYQAAIYQAA